MNESFELLHELLGVFGRNPKGAAWAREELAKIIMRLTAELTGDNRVGSCLSNAEMDAADAGRKLDAIKLYKNRTGASLMDAKNAVERYMG